MRDLPIELTYFEASFDPGQFAEFTKWRYKFECFNSMHDMTWKPIYTGWKKVSLYHWKIGDEWYTVLWIEYRFVELQCYIKIINFNQAFISILALAGWHWLLNVCFETLIPNSFIQILTQRWYHLQHFYSIVGLKSRIHGYYLLFAFSKLARTLPN